MPSEAQRSSDESAKRPGCDRRQEIDDFIIKTGVLLHRYGTPSHRIERVLTQLTDRLGEQGAFFYTPTTLMLSFGSGAGERTYMRRVDSGSINVDKLIRFDEILEALEAGSVTIGQASEQLDAVAESGPPFSTLTSLHAGAIGCATIAVLLGGNGLEVISALSLGLLIGVLQSVYPLIRAERGLFEPIAGLVASLGALAIARFIFPIDDRTVTLAAVIILIPGLGLTVAITELAVGHLSAGVARLAGASVSLLTIVVGVALGVRMAGHWRELPPEPQWELPAFSNWLAVLVAPIAFSILFSARWPQWPVIAAVTVCGFTTSLFAGQSFGIEVGAFCGALSVGIGSNLYARIRNRPALVPLTPGIIVLVPGSLGFRSLTALLDHETMVGIDFAFSMVIVAVSLVGGLLSANAVVPPRRIL